MDIKEFIKKEAREALAKEFTKEGLFELKEEELELSMGMTADYEEAVIVFILV